MKRTLTIGSFTFQWGSQTYIMGIINVTPDSFSGDGILAEDEWTRRAVEQGLHFAEAGAHILDIGGESTRPGATPVEAAEELRRVLPVIDTLSRTVDVPISIDTYKASVAAPARRYGDGCGCVPRRRAHCAPRTSWPSPGPSATPKHR
jgi:dihydropteroate synthase